MQVNSTSTTPSSHFTATGDSDMTVRHPSIVPESSQFGGLARNPHSQAGSSSSFPRAPLPLSQQQYSVAQSGYYLQPPTIYQNSRGQASNYSNSPQPELGSFNQFTSFASTPIQVSQPAPGPSTENYFQPSSQNPSCFWTAMENYVNSAGPTSTADQFLQAHPTSAAPSYQPAQSTAEPSRESSFQPSHQNTFAKRTSTWENRISQEEFDQVANAVQQGVKVQSALKSIGRSDIPKSTMTDWLVKDGRGGQLLNFKFGPPALSATQIEMAMQAQEDHIKRTGSTIGSVKAAYQALGSSSQVNQSTFVRYFHQDGLTARGKAALEYQPSLSGKQKERRQSRLAAQT